MSTLLLAEHDYQVRDFIGRGFASDCEWVALGPSAMACLDDLNIAYKTPEDFYSIDDFERFCEETHRQVESISDQLDDRLLKLYPDLKSRDMRPFRFHIFHLMMIFDAVRGRIFQLRRTFSSYPGQTIYIHNLDVDWSPPSLLFENGTTLWGKAASITERSGRLVTLPDVRQSQGVHQRRRAISWLKQYVFGSVSLTTAARWASLKDYSALLGSFAPDRQALLVVNAPYEWGQILSAFNETGHKIVFVNDDYFQSKQHTQRSQTSWSEAAEREFIKCFSFEDVDYYRLLQPQLAWIWNHSPGQFLSAARVVEDLKHRYKLCALLRCSAASGLDHAINQSARILGIPVFTWQHGAVNYCRRISQFRDYADRMTADYTFVYGKDAEAAYTRYGRDFSGEVVPIGAPSLDTIARRSGNSRNNYGHPVGSKLTILYATTNLMQNHWYHGWTPPFSDREFFRDQSVIIDYLLSAAAAGIAEVIIKLHPSKGYDEPAWVEKTAHLEGIRTVKSQESFEELLLQTDVVVLDFPSTVLLQSIATMLPVFLLTRHWQFPEGVAQRLQKRVVASDRADELMDHLKTFIETTGYAAERGNTSFLESFGTCHNDGKSADRAFEFVSKILASGQSAAYGAPLAQSTKIASVQKAQ